MKRALALSSGDLATLEGVAGLGAQFAMRLVCRVAVAMEAPHLIDISAAHVDGCLYHGLASLDFVTRLVDLGARVRVPTTLNVTSLDVLHPSQFRGGPETAHAARKLMDAHVALGCIPTWTCAPYQLRSRPSFGDQIAWGESNAIVFANSVLGARTNRYGDFLDLACAVVGRAPFAGLHVDDGRRGTIVFDVSGLPLNLLHEYAAYPLIGAIVGTEAGEGVPIIVGLPTGTGEDRLKVLGAAAASKGSIAMFHAVGITPEAPTLQAALGGGSIGGRKRITQADMVRMRDSFTTNPALTHVAAVSLGTPHYSVSEFEALCPLLEGQQIRSGTKFYVNTSRDVLKCIDQSGLKGILDNAGVQLIVDTCAYITPIMDLQHGVVMTNSAKCAHYAPGNIGVDIVFGSTKECVQSAIRGELWRDKELWGG